jgi:hypothetical protein
MLLLKLFYIANVAVAGTVGISSLFSPAGAARNVFSGAYAPSEVMRLVGCLWLAIALLSLAGLWQPLAFTPLLLLQLCYKSTWLVAVALPACRREEPFPRAMAL